MNTKAVTPQRGEIYFASLLSTVGSVEGFTRPVVILQNDIGNVHSPTTIVVPLSSQIHKHSSLPTHYFINADDGLKLPSVALAEQIQTIDKSQLGRYIGKLSSKNMLGVERAVNISLGLHKTSVEMRLCLCYRCAESFRLTGKYKLRRAEPDQVIRDTCDFCMVRSGFDYILVEKSD